MKFRSLSKAAYGKINLYLAVTGLRDDGYHTIETVFQGVDLCDRLSISEHNSGGISLRTNKSFLPTDGSNLAHRAASLFYERSGLENNGLYINIKKQLPVGAGMAGGSANAAAVLSMLNQMHNRPLSKAQLDAVALELGADVPYCLRGGAALAHGIGEKLTMLQSMPDCFIVILKPPFSVSAKLAYSLHDGCKQPPPPPVQNLLHALRSGDLQGVCSSMYNSLELPVCKERAEIKSITEHLRACGAMGAMMTGSGSASFGIFEDKHKAERAIKTANRRWESHLTRPI